MKKYDLSDLTFIIPLRLDSIDRLENLLFCTNYILSNYQTRVIVGEANERNTGFAKRLLHPEVEYFFYEDRDPVFYRTYYINKLVGVTDTSFIAVWDADVVVPNDQIIKSIESLRQNQADFVYPYKDIALNVPPPVKNIFFKSQDIAVLSKLASGFHTMYGPKAIGGGFLANRLKYIEAGMENENYYGWGLEDGERYYRLKKLGFSIKQIEGVLFHLDHKRGENSRFHAPDQHYIKAKEQFRIQNISSEVLRNEVKEWHKSKF